MSSLMSVDFCLRHFSLVANQHIFLFLFLVGAGALGKCLGAGAAS